MQFVNGRQNSGGLHVEDGRRDDHDDGLHDDYDDGHHDDHDDGVHD